MSHPMDMQQVDKAIEARYPALVALRRRLHEHPQAAYEETYAAGEAVKALHAAGIELVDGIAETGVVGWIKPAGAAGQLPAVALRADMDGLKMTEQSDLPWRSCMPGRMHGCGHDGHVAMLIGAAQVLSTMVDQLPRPVKFIFQPAEEGGGGARRMIDAGVLDESVGGLPVSMAFALHNNPRLPLGRWGTRVGPIMARVDDFQITMHGQGGHAALPHLATDPVLASAHVVCMLQSVISRNIDPQDPAVLSVTSIRAGDACNVIPQEALISGTVRSFNDSVSEQVFERLNRIVDQTASAMECRAAIERREGYPVTCNDRGATAYARRVAEQVLGRPYIIDQVERGTGAEDFAFFCRRVPSCYSHLGTCPQGQEESPMSLHSPYFDFNDQAMPTGIKLFCAWVLLAGTGSC